MQYFTLDHQVKFYVPSTEKASNKVSPKEFEHRTREIAGQLSDWFGGASIQNIQGFYKAHDGSIIVENIRVVVSFCDSESMGKHTQDLLNLAGDKCRKWSQESIGIELDSKMLFIN